MRGIQIYERKVSGERERDRGRSMKGELRSTSSCAACKFLKRKCSPTCIFAPYFKANESRKFARVHKVFGASNVSKILAEVPEQQRHDTVNSLAYEAELRLRDPVYGCIGAIAILQNQMLQLQHDLAIARARLALYTHYPPPPPPPPPDPLPDFLMLEETHCEGSVHFDRCSSELQCHGHLHLLL